MAPRRRSGSGAGALARCLGVPALTLAAVSIVAAGLVAPLPAALSDEVDLADGTRVDGKIVLVEETGAITVQLASGDKRPLAPTEIAAARGDELGRSIYVRFAGYGAGWSRLEVLTRTFASADGARRVSIVGVVHIADLVYYRRVQQQLDAHDLVLFEGLGAGPLDADRIWLPDADERARERKRPFRPGAGFTASDLEGLDPLSGFQSGLAATLELDFQKDGVDYTHSWWHPADVSGDELLAILGERDRSLFVEAALLSSEELQAASNAALAAAAAEALASPLTGKPLRVILKEAFAKLLCAQFQGEAGGDAAADGGGADPDAAAETEAAPKNILQTVLIEGRNRVVMERLDQVLAGVEAARSIAIFYGAGHGPDLERRLRERGFRPVRDEWLAAWNIRSAARPLVNGN